MQKESEHILKLRNLTPNDYQDIVALSRMIYKESGDFWDFESIKNLVEFFPEGQICIEDKGKVVAFAFTIIIDYSKFGDEHTYAQITASDTYTTHDPNGDIFYGIEICIHPEYRDMRLGRRLYNARKDMCEQFNLRGIVAGGRMPNYSQYADKLTPREYIEKVRQKEIYDPVLTFQMSNDFHVEKILSNYMPSDLESRSYATLIKWNNIYYSTPKSNKVVTEPKSVIRLGIVQWQMRNVRSLSSFFENVEFFVDAVSSYEADFIVFPEFFSVPLMAEFNEMHTAKAIRKLADYTEGIREKLIEYAVSYNINIIGGSLPIYENETLYNVSYLCRRDGTYDMQYKIHITPSEISDYGIVGGNKVKVFDTDVARIGILICYDVEFPELSRLMADEGLQILFVPFSTDMQNGYMRVRVCAQARAVENECYVAIAGSVGNLPKVKNMDVQYAQSAVFSPSDFAFPNNTIVAESTPNTEMTMIADVNLDLLKELHQHGSVRNLKDRRKDIYRLDWIDREASR
ncbi:MAG: bifunctional GNAT family N-acetyltransferase/carbon-nitrogen hydrolase family protein [Bernardetiaceae bacterium]|nr:bifunctional GNAT family N-acetyltransferase/carbon-nitrogen hydrolase family protein [Bernardetiaceae bacterium]